MRLYIAILLALLTLSCQKESLVQDESSSENDLVQNEILNKAVLSVSAHDGSFDDIIDNSGCFSVKFPYTIVVNNEEIEILSVNDLLVLDLDENFMYQFPISITFSNYVELQINSEMELAEAQGSCATNQIFIDSIRCVDFVYPIKIAVYNIDTSTFETITIDHDRQNFQSVSAFILEQKASLNFPLSIQIQDGTISQVTSVNELISLVYSNEDNCN